MLRWMEEGKWQGASILDELRPEWIACLAHFVGALILVGLL